VRIALVENRQRLRQATRHIKASSPAANDLPELRRAERAAASNRIDVSPRPGCEAASWDYNPITLS